MRFENDPIAPLLSKRDATAYLGISLSTLDRWTRAGVLPSHRLGRTIRYQLAELQAAVQTHRR